MIDERRDDGGLVIRYVRTEKIEVRDRWGHISYRRPETRASCVIYLRDKFVVPIDLVSTEEMRDYLQARSERHAYLDMVPLLQAAITAREDEAAVEEPFRAMLAGQLALTHNNLTVEDATHQIEELVQWWKHTTVHFRPLVSTKEPGVAHKATREIIAEYGARQRAAAATLRDASRNAEIVEHLRAEIPDVMLIARKRDGTYIAFSPQPRKHPEPVAHRDVYVREHASGRRASTINHRDWVLPTKARIETWTILWTSPAWDGGRQGPPDRPRDRHPPRHPPPLRRNPPHGDLRVPHRHPHDRTDRHPRAHLLHPRPRRSPRPASLPGRRHHVHATAPAAHRATRRRRHARADLDLAAHERERCRAHDHRTRRNLRVERVRTPRRRPEGAVA